MTVEATGGDFFRQMNPALNGLVTTLKMSFYPNPATNEITISLDGTNEKDHVELTLQDMQGRKVASLYKGNAEPLATGKKLLLPSLATGVYFLHSFVNQNELPVQKLIIQ